jgi:hypothetical protein
MTDPTVTDEDLAEIQERVEAALHISAEHASWRSDRAKVGYYHGGRWYTIAHVGSWEGDQVDVDVATFIAHARTDVPRLIAALRASREREAALEELRAYCLSMHVSDPTITDEEGRIHYGH